MLWITFDFVLSVVYVLVWMGLNLNGVWINTRAGFICDYGLGVRFKLMFWMNGASY